MNVFPDIGLDRNEFSSKYLNFLFFSFCNNLILLFSATGKKIGREFFIQFAKSKNFDYKDENIWLSITRRDLCDSKVHHYIIELLYLYTYYISLFYLF